MYVHHQTIHVVSGISIGKLEEVRFDSMYRTITVHTDEGLEFELTMHADSADKLKITEEGADG